MNAVHSPIEFCIYVSKPFEETAGSGVQVIAPEECGEILTADSEVWVANPNHLADVAKFLEDFSVEVTTPIMAAL
jgi:hypothetical protein